MEAEYIRAMPADDPYQPLRVTTPREMLAGGYTIEVYCPDCKAWRPVDLQRMVKAGRGDERLIGRTWRCRRCGGVGQMQLQPPVPGHSRPPR